MKKKTNWKLIGKMLLVCIITTFMVLPYTLALSPEIAKLFTPLVYVVQIVQSGILFGGAIFFGLKLAKKTGFGMEVWEGAKPISWLRSVAKISVGLGVLAGILIILLSVLFGSMSVDFLRAEVEVARWKSILASFYGGIGEEVLFRLFVMNLLVWIMMKIKKEKEGKASAVSVWVGNVLTSVLFGLGHLGITGSMTTITGPVVLRAILLNGVGGTIFGWLYWKKGLESAMIAHFSADIVIHVITPIVGGWLV